MTQKNRENTYNNLLNRIKTEPQFKANREYCLMFAKSSDALGLSIHTKTKYLDKIRYISESVPDKDFKKWTRKDVETVFAKLRSHAKPWTIDSFMSFFKHFWRYIYDLSSNDIAPEAVKWLQRQTPENGIKKEDLLTRDEIQRMMDSTKNIEWKSLIAILSAGARPNEALTITLGNIHDSGEILKVYVRAKPVKGKMRSMRAIYPGFFIKGQGHIDVIRQWVNSHPKKNDKSARLFDGMTYCNMRSIIERLADKSGIMATNKKGKFLGGKRVWPYLFRHTFGTWAYSRHNSTYARRLMGHAAGSKMESVYCHLSEEDLENVLLGKVQRKEDQNIEETENKTQRLISLGKAIEKLAQEYPEAIDIEKLGKLGGYP